ncbi:hypothetical protein [Blastopirellula marina]|uniref:Tyrosine kinase G-rich domain-containing protein n=1 Tax=Blastopirellula marina TaxID=124 RepID=A0A2S8GNI2_9BACT|nr:hypothetical protein [Blastopirellula marina]PQO45979.1 hypothetical protein C5Y93_12060 [Blastopirellula marina]
METTLIHVGLPNTPGGKVYEEFPPETCAALVTSPQLLNQLRERRQLQMPIAILERMITVKSSRGGLINIEFEWSDPMDGIEMLNDLTGMFVEEMAAMRKDRIQNHMKHVELAALNAGSEIDTIRQRIDRLRREQSELLASDGQHSDQYRSVLTSVVNTQLAIDDKRLQELGIQHQLQAIERKISAAKAQIGELDGQCQAEMLRSLLPVLQKVKLKFVETSAQYAEAETLAGKFSAEIDESPAESPTELASNEEVTPRADQESNSTAPVDIGEWQRNLETTLSQYLHLFSVKEREELALVLGRTLDAAVVKRDQFLAEIQSLERKHEEFSLALIPVANQLEMLGIRLGEYRKQASEMGGGPDSIAFSQLEEAELELEKAIARQDAFSLQQESMEQLAECRVREWAVSEPSGIENTTVDSNRKKIAVMIFAICGAILGGPLLLLEIQHCRDLPHIRIVRSLGLPLLTERVLKSFSPKSRAPWETGKDASPDIIESLRMLVLRIQQSCRRQGSVILFASLGESPASASLTAAVAQCLADREEKVLIVDAICPGAAKSSTERLLAPVLVEAGKANIKSQEETLALSEIAADQSQFGLSELLSGKSVAYESLIRNTGVANVDILVSGAEPFHREAMATSGLTRLLEGCRQVYSIILIRGPSACNAADTQMLTARADGVVVLAGTTAHRNQAAQNCVKDLMELGAPIIGVVA